MAINQLQAWWRRVPLGERYSLGWSIIAIATLLNLLFLRVARPLYAWLESETGLLGELVGLLVVLFVFAPAASAVFQALLPLERLRDPRETNGT